MANVCLTHIHVSYMCPRCGMVTTFQPVRSCKTNYQMVNNLLGAMRRRRKMKDDPNKTYIPTANEFAGWVRVEDNG